MYYVMCLLYSAASRNAIRGKGKKNFIYAISFWFGYCSVDFVRTYIGKQSKRNGYLNENKNF